MNYVINSVKRLVFLLLIITIALILTLVSQAKEIGDPVYNSNGKVNKKIALTFDDGPHPKQTVKIAELLNLYDVKATFFVIGINAQNYPTALKKIIESGHEIGNHTFSHNILKSMPRLKIEEEIFNTEKEIQKELHERPKLIRPPGGLYGDNLIEIAKEENYKIILWTIDTHDWAHASTDSIVNNILKNIKDGDIILFHDYISGEANTLNALKKVIPKLKSMGYEFVTVSELLQE